jgi:adenosylmethionine-8-amino-7-oxononanoate aminotransferase
MTSNSSSRALWHGQAHMPSVLADPITIVRGEGAYLETSTGQRLLDATAGLWHANVGHGREELAKAAYDQMRTLETWHVFGRFANNRAIDLAQRLVAMGPIPDAKVIWTSGGSDAVDTACKLARRHWQLAGKPNKRFILSRDKSYHGLHAFGTSIAGLEFNREGYGGESLIPETARVPHMDLAGIEAEINALGADNIAAIIAEPIMGTGGVLPPDPAFLTGLQELARRNSILFIADEVITGFGRTGYMFASERFGIEPDMVLFAKGITSGYAPLGGLFVGPAVYEKFYAGDQSPIFRHGITYSGHATCCAVADANLDLIEREQLVARAAALEGVLLAASRGLGEDPAVQDVRVGGFMAGVQLTDDIPASRVADRCIELGVAIRPINDNTLQICPPLIVTEDEIGTILSTIEKSINVERALGSK